jgi:hypothetical protein
METFPLTKNGERAIAFEIENVYVSCRSIVYLLKQTDGVTDVHLRGSFASSEDIRIEFKYFGLDYIVWEPFGDNSRYWIGPKNREEGIADVTGLEGAFKRYQPPLYRALLGDLLTLRLFRRFAGRH